jgi:hypothetical protein
MLYCSIVSLIHGVFFLISQIPKRIVHHSIKKEGNTLGSKRTSPQHTDTHTSSYSFECGIAFFNCDQIHYAFSHDLTYIFLQVNLLAARNERESFQIALCPKVSWATLGIAESVQIQCTDLCSSLGDMFVCLKFKTSLLGKTIIRTVLFRWL